MTKDEQLVEQLDAEIRAIEAADPTETSGAALLRGAKEKIERLEAENAELTGMDAYNDELEQKCAHERQRAEKAERELAESKEEARELRQINAQAIKGRIACSDLLAEARAEIAAWERKFGGRTDFNEALTAPAPEECPHGCRGTGWIGAGNSWGDTAALPCPLHEPIPKSEAERRVVDEPCKHELVPWVTEGRGGAIPRTPPLKCKKCDRFEKDILAAQQEPTPDEESGDE